jgi:hypothetical protein
MRLLYKVQEGNAEIISADDAKKFIESEDYGQNSVLAFCENENEALELADKYDNYEIQIDNLPGQENINYGLSGISRRV